MGLCAARLQVAAVISGSGSSSRCLLTSLTAAQQGSMLPFPSNNIIEDAVKVSNSCPLKVKKKVAKKALLF